MILDPSHHEQEVAEPVEIHDQGGGNVSPGLAGQPHDQPFGAAANRARQVQLGRRQATSRQDEIRERFEL